MTLSDLALRRNALLRRIVAFLQSDERFVAAWLAGSFGRNEPDDLSDLDLHVVVVDEFASQLLDKTTTLWSATLPERRALFEQFGKPVLLQEHHQNAICNGVFTCCIYDDLTQVDWTLMAKSQAKRPHFSQLLFDSAEIPHDLSPQPEPVAERQTIAAERNTFFWLMAIMCAKQLIRNDVLNATGTLGILHNTLNEVARLLQGKPQVYKRLHIPKLDVSDLSKHGLTQLLRDLCKQMLMMQPRVEAFVGLPAPTPPTEMIERFLQRACN
jgi:Streptomycin adenylyltransferase